jgi:hypothetical protein
MNKYIRVTIKRKSGGVINVDYFHPKCWENKWSKSPAFQSDNRYTVTVEKIETEHKLDCYGCS